MSILPNPTIKFEDCQVGRSIDCSVTLKNKSLDLPLKLLMPRSAHFVPLPLSAQIGPDAEMDLVISFRPNQIGNFKPKIDVVVIGYTCEIGGDFNSLPKFTKVPIFKFPLQVEGVCFPVVGSKTAKSVSAQGRLYQKGDSSDNPDPVSSYPVIKTAVNGRECRSITNVRVLLAHPDDRSTSIRPSNTKEKVV